MAPTLKLPRPGPVVGGGRPNASLEAPDAPGFVAAARPRRRSSSRGSSSGSGEVLERRVRRSCSHGERSGAHCARAWWAQGPADRILRLGSGRIGAGSTRPARCAPPGRRRAPGARRSRSSLSEEGVHWVPYPPRGDSRPFSGQFATSGSSRAATSRRGARWSTSMRQEADGEGDRKRFGADRSGEGRGSSSRAPPAAGSLPRGACEVLQPRSRWADQSAVASAGIARGMWRPFQPLRIASLALRAMRVSRRTQMMLWLTSR